MSEEKAIYVTAEGKMRTVLGDAYQVFLKLLETNKPGWRTPTGIAGIEVLIAQIDEVLAMKSPDSEDIEGMIDRAFDAGYKQRDTEYGLKARHVQELISSAYKEGKMDRDDETAIQLIELPASIKSQSSAISDLTADIEKLRMSIATSNNQSWELVLCATVTDNGKTKEKYTNEKARKMAVEQLLREDKLYLENCDELGRKECELRAEQIQLDYLHNMFKAYLAVAQMHGVR